MSLRVENQDKGFWDNWLNMLDNETKRRIDTARDILVGKVPDPKSQVEQITIALIYKFMDDMDSEAEELGGKRSFFAGEFEKYGWSKMMASGVGGHDVLKLYSEAISKINENAGIPLLFRDIFKNAYLPYRDPETLKSFLKIIGDFEYDHSERLGDAFEYLLSVLGSQGDAGQFRTPRHIIDFMVEVIDPKKNETILDPACGTAGFLISSYKHIMKSNSKDGRVGAALTPDERARLAKNITGYDISPDMVRLSLVNLYLHGFTDPHIDEYDTLTSEEKWNEYGDVILANPPFMSPKGGGAIKPHKRFSVQSKRSEVLFVDYMAEHLTPDGRAAIIVPEGIIFKSQNAYKQLRKMLVEEYLFAVVSLPSGVFKPYSGVKTSILLMDKVLAKRSDSILFIKIEKDGFDLGDQRRPNGKSDLPDAVCSIKDYVSGIVNGDSFDAENIGNVLVVGKEKIGEKEDWNLNGERYRENNELRNSNYDLKSFNEVCTLEYGGSLPKRNRIVGDYPVVGSNGITGYHNEFLIEGPAIIVGRKGSAGEVVLIKDSCYPIDTTYYIKINNPEECDLIYLYHMLLSLDLPSLKGGAGIPGLNRNDVYEKFKIPLPPLEIQKEIVAEIEGYQKIIDGACAVVENYKPHIQIEPEWEMVELGDAADIVMGQSPKGESYNMEGLGIPLINGPVEFGSEPFSKTIKRQYTTAPTKLCKENDLILCVRGSTTGRMNIAGFDACIGRGVALIRSDKYQKWINNMINIMRDKIHSIGTGSTFPNVNLDTISKLQIPLPPLEIQNQIVTQIEKEQALVNANKELVAIFEQKIKDKIASVWGE